MFSSPLGIFPSKEKEVAGEMGCINEWMAMVEAGNQNARMDHTFLRCSEHTHIVCVWEMLMKALLIFIANPTLSLLLRARGKCSTHSSKGLALNMAQCL